MCKFKKTLNNGKTIYLQNKVVYGDTDSLFVTLPGRSHKEGFDFGEQLCEAVRMASPPPVELKLEKVYVQSIMQTVRTIEMAIQQIFQIIQE